MPACAGTTGRTWPPPRSCGGGRRGTKRTGGEGEASRLADVRRQVKSWLRMSERKKRRKNVIVNVASSVTNILVVYRV